MTRSPPRTGLPAPPEFPPEGELPPDAQPAITTRAPAVIRAFAAVKLCLTEAPLGPATASGRCTEAARPAPRYFRSGKPLFPPNLAVIRRDVNSRPYLDRRRYRVVTFRAVRYVVVGCGAIGGTIAAGLIRDGHDVLVCDNDLDVVRAVNAAGIRIEGPVEQFTARASAVLPDELPSQIDGPVLIAVKAHNTAAVAEALAGRLAAGGYVVSLQNGLNAPVLSAALGGDRVVEAVVNFGADVLEPGIVLRGNRATFLIGELDGRTTDRVRALVADITDAEATEVISGYAWAKEAYGATLFATAVSDLPIHAVFDNPAYRPLLVAVAAEVLRQAPVRALPLDGFDPADIAGSLDRLAEFNRLSAKTHSGIYRDLTIRHRKTETEA